MVTEVLDQSVLHLTGLYHELDQSQTYVCVCVCVDINIHVLVVDLVKQPQEN